MVRFFIFLQFCLAICVSSSFWSNSKPEDKEPEIIQDPTDYGVDVSFPIHHKIKKTTYFGQRYENLMQGCYKKYSKPECDGTENARIEMNFDQPRIEHNYTELGFKKLVTPDSIWDPLIKWYNENKEKEVPEKWPRGNTYVNHWDSPTSMISFEDRALRGGFSAKDQIWAGVKPILEEWVGKTNLVPTSLYGIRVYKEGAILATHVDRLPLVTSCIIQVDQDLDEPWPLEVYSHTGKAYNVTMKPRDMVLYESHTTLHGRPFPLKGRKYANVFVHFSPADHAQINEQDKKVREEEKRQPIKSDAVRSSIQSMKDTFQKYTSTAEDQATKGQAKGKGKEPSLMELRKNMKQAEAGQGGHESENHDPQALQKHVNQARERGDKEEIEEEMVEEEQQNQQEEREEGEVSRDEGSEEESDQPREEEGEEEESQTLIINDKTVIRTDLVVDRKDGSQARVHLMHDPDGRTALHLAAAQGDLPAVESLLKDRPDSDLLHARDENGWQAIHEAARAGSVEVMQYLVEMGADISAETENGGPPLWWARRTLEDPSHPLIQYLESIGAPEGDTL